MGGSSEVRADDDLEATLPTSSGLSSLSFPLISFQDERRRRFRREEIIDEAKRQLNLAGPLIGVSLLQYCLQVISLMYVGHLGELPLSGASMATSFASVTGFSVLTGPILALLGQDPDISAEAGAFNRWMVPGLFAYSLLQCLNRFFQAQNDVLPMMVSSAATACLHVLVCWVLVFPCNLASRGAALANSISYWVNVGLLAGYLNFSPAYLKTWTGFSREALRDLLSFVRLAVPSAIMIWLVSLTVSYLKCLEYWSFEMVVLLSGLLPNPKLETSVLSVSLNTCWMVYMISVGLGGAISTRVSNELGAGKAEEARLALLVMVVIALTEGAAVAITTISVRHIWGRLYSTEGEVIQYVAKMMPLLALSDFLDGFQCVLSGAARGCGWQNLCSYINLGAYYVVAIPSAVVLAFVLHIGGTGLWMGIICGLSVQAAALVTVNVCTNWDAEVRMCSSSFNGNVLCHSSILLFLCQAWKAVKRVEENSSRQ
ncbi:hypothetical protein SAY86_008968 [Trapa natans]|uniref:Protein DETOXIFICATION n=1 Tax=Trapa natans TaxID=22666 RepID=A0AAN7K9K5_TRANT|nr:hypothetical protein SAY86_008968 [Trapa natans]